MTPSHCSTCNREILPGTGRYITPDGIYCSSCGLPFLLGPNVRVQITIIDPDGKLNQYGKEAS